MVLYFSLSNVLGKIPFFKPLTSTPGETSDLTDSHAGGNSELVRGGYIFLSLISAHPITSVCVCVIPVALSYAPSTAQRRGGVWHLRVRVCGHRSERANLTRDDCRERNAANGGAD